MLALVLTEIVGYRRGIQDYPCPDERDILFSKERSFCFVLRG